MSVSGWIGVDLDGTLAQYSGWMGPGSIGSPVPAMVERIKRWQDEGVEIRIVTARAGDYDYWVWAKKEGLLNGFDYEKRFAHVDALYNNLIKPIEDWCENHFGQRFRVTAMKDFAMVELWDDRAVQVDMNTGRRISESQ